MLHKVRYLVCENVLPTARQECMIHDASRTHRKVNGVVEHFLTRHSEIIYPKAHYMLFGLDFAGVAFPPLPQNQFDVQECAFQTPAGRIQVEHLSGNL